MNAIRKRVLCGTATAALFLTAALPSAMAAVEGSFQRDLQVSGPVNLDVATGSGNITITTGGSGQVHISGHIRASRRSDSDTESRVRQLEQNPPIVQNGNTIRVGHIENSELRRNISISYELVVPVETEVRSNTGSGNVRVEGTRGELHAESGSGSLDIRRIGASVRAHTGSGDIVLDDIHGSAKVHTGSGSIRADKISAGFDGETGSGGIELRATGPGAVRAEAGSGSVELHGVSGSLNAQTGSGNIEAEGTPEGPWIVHTGSGSVRLRVPQQSNFELDAHTGSGHINANHPVTVQGTMGRHDLRGKVGGGGVPVEVHTGSGNVDID